jgi:hypothetical protein
LVLTAFLVVGALVCAAEERKPDEYYDPHVRELMSAKIVRLERGSSEDVVKESGDSAFGEILAKENAMPCFITAFEYGSDEARCYALIALREMNPKYFAASIKWFRSHAPKRLRVYNGDATRESEVSTLLDEIEAGRFRWYFEKKEKEASQSPVPRAIQRGQVD